MVYAYADPVPIIGPADLWGLKFQVEYADGNISNEYGVEAAIRLLPIVAKKIREVPKRCFPEYPYKNYPMHDYVLAKIKDQDQFEQVFPLPFNGDNNLARFIRSILGQKISVRKATGQFGGFHYVSDINPRWIIMPSWIEYFDTEELIPASPGQEEYIGLVVYWDGNVVVLGR